MRKLITGLCIALGLTMASQARAETTECTEITTIPIVITVQGVYCLKGNLATDITSGNAIDIQTNNVTIDFNGFKLGGLAAGPGTNTYGIYAKDRRNILLRNGSVRGFFYGIWLDGDTTTSSGHLIEDMISDANTSIGIYANGTGMVIRNNRVVNTGPGDVRSVAFGIVLALSRNSEIVGNLVSKTNETFRTYGVFANNSNRIEIRNNSILETEGASDNYGIFADSDLTLIQNNRIINTTSGSSAIDNDFNASRMYCIGNVIEGFTETVSSCAFAMDNYTP